MKLRSDYHRLNQADRARLTRMYGEGEHEIEDRVSSNTLTTLQIL